MARVSFHHRVLLPRSIGRDKGQVDLGFHCGGKLDLCLFGGFFQPLKRHLVRRQVNSLIFLKFIDDPLDQHLIDVVAAEMGVSVGRFDLDNTFADLKDRDIERTAAEVEDRDGLVLFLISP